MGARAPQWATPQPRPLPTDPLAVLQSDTQSVLCPRQGPWLPRTGPGRVVSPLPPFSKPQPPGGETLSSMPLGPEGGSRGDRGSVSGQPHVLVWEVTWGQMALWAPQGPAQALVPPSPVLIPPRVWGLFCAQGACGRGER